MFLVPGNYVRYKGLYLPSIYTGYNQVQQINIPWSTVQYIKKRSAYNNINTKSFTEKVMTYQVLLNFGVGDGPNLIEILE